MALQIFETLDSTNLEALRQISNGDWVEGYGRPQAILARSQSLGRARSGRTWESEVGNLHVSLICQPKRALHQWPNLGLVVGVTLVDLFRDILGISVCLKWPNDVLVEGAKIAGILLEVGHQNNQKAALVVGVGINLAHTPKALDRPKISVGEILKNQGNIDGLAQNFAPLLSPEMWARAFMRKFEEKLARWEVEGFAAFQADWLKSATGIGQKMTVRLPNESFPATMLGINDEGVLLARLSSGDIRQVSSGELYFGE